MNQTTLAAKATHAEKDIFIAKLLADLRAAGKQAQLEREAHSETKGDLAVAKRVYTPKADKPCTKCSGTGQYGDHGDCFQCEGKGVQNDADQRRNWGYRASHKVAGNEAPKRAAYVPPAPTEAQLSFRERCAAAKAAAIAGGQAVLV